MLVINQQVAVSNYSRGEGREEGGLVFYGKMFGVSCFFLGGGRSVQTFFKCVNFPGGGLIFMGVIFGD